MLGYDVRHPPVALLMEPAAFVRVGPEMVDADAMPSLLPSSRATRRPFAGMRIPGRPPPRRTASSVAISVFCGSGSQCLVHEMLMVPRGP